MCCSPNREAMRAATLYYTSIFLVALVSDCFGYVFSRPIFNYTSHRRQSKTIILSTNGDLRSLETEFLIAVCRPTVNYS